MANDLTLTLRLKAEGKDFVGNVRVAKSELGKMTGETRQLGRVAEGEAARGLRTLSAAVKTFVALLVANEVRKFSQSIVRAGTDMQKFSSGLRAATGSQQTAASALQFVRAEAERLGLGFTDLAGSYTQLAAAAKGTTLEGQQARKIFSAVAEASRVMGLSGAEAEGALRAIAQMMSKGTVQAEELRGQLGERIPGAFQIAARAMGVTTAELGKMLESGKVLAEDLLPKLAVELRKTVSPGLKDATGSAAAEFERMRNAFADLQRQLAQGGLLSMITGLAKAAAAAAGAIGLALDRLGLVQRRIETLDLGELQRSTIPAAEKRVKSLEEKLSDRTPGFHRQGVRRSPALQRQLKEARDELAALRTRERDLREALLDALPDPLNTPLRGPRGSAATFQRAAAAGMKREAEVAARERKEAERRRRAFEATAKRIAEEEAELTEMLIEQEEERTRRRRAALQARLDDVTRTLETEREAEQRRFQAQLRDIAETERQAGRLRLETSIGFQELRERAEAEHQRRLVEMAEAGSAQLADTVDESTERMREAVEQLGFSFASAFEDAIVRGKSLSEVLRGLAQDVQRIFLRKTVTEPLAGKLASFASGLFGGGLSGPFKGGAGPAFGSFRGAQTLHSGGIAGRAGVTRAVPASAFAAARRFAAGGIAGDEVPAILHRGEEVLTTGDPRHRRNLGGGVTIAITNNVDARGAAPGVEARIEAAMQKATSNAVRQIKAELVTGGQMSRLVGAG